MTRYLEENKLMTLTYVESRSFRVISLLYHLVIPYDAGISLISKFVMPVCNLWHKQAQNIVQFSPSAVQLQTRVLQGVALLHPHLMRRMTNSGASSVSTGKGTGCRVFNFVSLIQPCNS